MSNAVVTVAGKTVKATATLRFTVENLVNAFRVKMSAFHRTGKVSREDGAEVNRLVRDVVGLMNFAVSEDAIRDWLCTADLRMVAS